MLAFEKILLKILGLGDFYAVRRFTKHFPRIITYHRFGPRNAWRILGRDYFEYQLRLILKNYNIISLKALSGLLKSGNSIPPMTAVLTVDDGYADFYYHAYPILKKYQTHATVYVTTEFVDKKIWLWPDVIQYILSNTKFQNYVNEIKGNKNIFSLESLSERRHAWNELADYCLSLKTTKKLEFIRDLSKDLKVTVPPIPDSEYEALTWHQIREMQKNRIDFGSHTCTHPRLVMLEEADLIYELRESKRRIEEMLDNEVQSFCYPNGMQEDFNEKIKGIVKESGYQNAVKAFSDNNISDMYEISRYVAGPDISHFEKILYGVEYLSTAIRKTSPWIFFWR